MPSTAPKAPGIPIQREIKLEMNTTPTVIPQRPMDLMAQTPVLNSQFVNSSPNTVISVSAHQKTPKKSGVKRKADTTTLEPLLSSTPLEEGKPSKMTTRRESGRPIKKPSKELPDLGTKKYPKKRVKNSEQMKFCNSIMKELLSKKYKDIALPFVKPVTTDDAPNYFEVIKHPMDLQTVKKKLSNHEYRNKEEFAADVRLIFTNCYKFNPPSDAIVLQARKLQVNKSIIFFFV